MMFKILALQALCLTRAGALEEVVTRFDAALKEQCQHRFAEIGTPLPFMRTIARRPAGGEDGHG